MVILGEQPRRRHPAHVQSMGWIEHSGKLRRAMQGIEKQRRGTNWGAKGLK